MDNMDAKGTEECAEWGSRKHAYEKQEHAKPCKRAGRGKNEIKKLGGFFERLELKKEFLGKATCMCGDIM